jgi:hypothetical protein
VGGVEHGHPCFLIESIDQHEEIDVRLGTGFPSRVRTEETQIAEPAPQEGAKLIPERFHPSSLTASQPHQRIVR